MAQYDYLIVGCGLFGSVFAQQATARGKKCLIIEKRDHIGGNIYCGLQEDIILHQYGAHIFHTSNRRVWDYVNRFADFNRYTNSPIANFKGEIYNLPFNMNTFNKMWGVRTPQEAQEKIDSQRAQITGEPRNLEEQAIRLVGNDIYQKLIKGYTEKQWEKDCSELPTFIIKRLPVRFTYDNNYFNDDFQGIPRGGYNMLAQGLIEGCEVRLNTDFFANREEFMAMADRVVYTGMLDAFYSDCFGKLEYRSLRFESELLDIPNYQGVAVVNYTDRETPFTRIIEHKHFDFGTQPKTVVTREYSVTWQQGMEPYYPVNDEKNQALLERYMELARQEKKVLFGGRLAEYKYYDMDKVIASSLDAVDKEFGVQ